jgi:SAM-dependent methyltransferase
MVTQDWLDKHFLNIRLNEHTLDAYIPRRAILAAVKEYMPVFSGTLLDVGCGQMPYKNLILQNNKAIEKYIGMDLDSSSIHDTSVADLHWDAHTIPLDNATMDCAMATEVLEHSFVPEQTLGEINRVLKPGGKFFFTVPFIWPLHEVPYDAYRYTPFSLRRHLENTGYRNIEIKPLGGWHASFAQMLGLWAIESKLEGFKRKLAIGTAKRLIPYLLKLDNKDNSFKHHSMPTGLYGIAEKI